MLAPVRVDLVEHHVQGVGVSVLGARVQGVLGARVQGDRVNVLGARVGIGGLGAQVVGPGAICGHLLRLHLGLLLKLVKDFPPALVIGSQCDYGSHAVSMSDQFISGDELTQLRSRRRSFESAKDSGTPRQIGGEGPSRGHELRSSACSTASWRSILHCAPTSEPW